MTKQEAIEQAKQELAKTGVTQFVLRRGDKYQVFPSDRPSPQGWKTAEMISKGNVHAY
jgi:5,10-methylenetetrahydrofolate reductase